MIGQLGLRGISVLESSGDTGEYNALVTVLLPSYNPVVAVSISGGFILTELSSCPGVGAPCQSNDGNKTPQFTPQFPGTCPFITAVGGTQSLEPEVAWIASSGGFSNYFKRPRYQSSAVETYLANYISPAVLDYYKTYFNRDNRGFPDVSAHSLTPE